MYDLTDFGLSEMTMVGAALRHVGRGAASLEDASQAAARFFCEQFVEPDGRPTFVLARCYATLDHAALPADLAAYARGVFPDEPIDDRTQCMTLLGTHGDAPEWRSRAGSTGHKSIPLATASVVDRLPMVARLIGSLGLKADELVNPDPTFLLEKERQGFNVFHVEAALGSPYIPAQASFVEPFGVRSVLGFGFLVPPTQIFATILFSRQTIAAPTAELFKTLALSLKIALLGVAGRRMFDEER